MDLDVRIIIENMPYGTKGFVHKTAEGSYIIYLNAKYGDSQNMRTYLHELEHIIYDDFCNDLEINELENKRHCG